MTPTDDDPVMTDFPIIFSAPMVRALLDGRKTMTRRMAWRWKVHLEKLPTQEPTPWQNVKPGDRLWVRETALYWIRNSDNKRVKVAAYAAEGYQLETGERWTPSIHMPRWASRLTLHVTATKIERLQSISSADAIAEGCGVMLDHPNPSSTHEPFPALAFRDLWRRLHGPASWDANPDVVAITFKVEQANIREARKAA